MSDLIVASKQRYTAAQVLQNTVTSSIRALVCKARHSFARKRSMGKMDRSVRAVARLVTSFEHLAHPYCFKTVMGGSKSRPGAPIMAKEAQAVSNFDLYTPELYFVPHPAVTEIQVDALCCALLRAEAIVCMLQGQFNGSGGNRYNDEIIANALWAVEGCIEQAKTIVQQPSCVRASEVQ